MIKRLGKFVGILAIGLALTLAVPVSSIAAANPLLTVKYLVTNLNSDGGAWKEETTAANGDVLYLYLELHNTEVSTTAVNPRVRATFTTGTFTNGTSTVRFWADNAPEVRDQIALTIPGGGSLAYITGSTQLTWDADGDGTKEFDRATLADGIASGGISLPADMKGCNQFIAQITFRVRVKGGEASPTPTPTPTPTPAVTPTPTPGAGQQQSQSQSQTQNNTQTQTVNVTQNVTSPTPTPQVAGIKELPKTGATVLAWSALASGIPAGIGLRWYAARLRRRSQTEPDLDVEDGASWLELTAQKRTRN